MPSLSRRRLFAAVSGAVLAGALPLAALAAPKRAAAILSERDKADVARAEDYLNAITTLKARFLQTAENGAQAEGTAYLSRPGKMRLQYDPPNPMLVVADGTFLIVHDQELGEPSYIPLGSTPAGVLVRENVRLMGGDVSVTRVVRLPGVLNVSLVETEEPEAGELTLVFSESPFALRQWRVKDAQGAVTSVSLFEAQTGLKLDPKLFEFQNPNFNKPQLREG